MFSLRCRFGTCTWTHVHSVVNPNGTRYGVYQCPRCKTISTGVAREEEEEEKTVDDATKS